LAISFLEDVQAITSVLYELSRALIRLFSHNGDKDALNEAIIAAEEAVEATPDDHQDWPMYAEGLAMSLLCKFTEDESIVDMNKAIAIGRKILARTSEESPEFADRADLLAVGVTYRYQITGDKDHIADAVAMWEKVVTRNAGRDPNKLAERQFFLGRSLAAWHFSRVCEAKLPKEWDKLDEAIRWMKKSLQLMHPKHPGYLEGLESLHSMVILRGSYHQALPKSPHIDSRKSPDDREELAHLYLQASRVHPSLSKYCGYALWWQRQYKAAIHFLEMPTQHRDEGAHDTSCGDCKTEPLKGIRYRCELCFNYDLCQVCFGRHAPNSQHKFRPIVSRSSKQIPLIQPLLPPNTSLNPSIFTRVF
jgi:tetratricopeptide (TPR) repeat protein